MGIDAMRGHERRDLGALEACWRRIAPGAAISLVGLALLARDGALMIAAYILSAVAIFILLRYSPLASMLGL